MDHRKLVGLLNHRFNGRAFVLSEFTLDELDDLCLELKEFLVQVEKMEKRKKDRRIKESKKKMAIETNKMDYEESEDATPSFFAQLYF